MPFAFLSPEDKDRVSFVNPAGVDLLAYETKVSMSRDLPRVNESFIGRSFDKIVAEMLTIQ